MINLMKKYRNLLVFVIFIIFIYLRLSPIINKTVPYTYDQGRDFLKAEEIIRDKNITFLGPTTGIAGVNHGAWWYYLLSVFYLIFSGWPIGFYLGLFFISTLSIVLFYFFIRKEFGWLSSLLFLLIITSSPYFVRLSFFASNNTVSPLFILLFIFSAYKYFKTESQRYLFFISFSLGFIFEFEVAFGLFIIVSFIVTSLFFKEFQKAYFNIKKLPYLLGGFLIPMLPRILFEIKNNFIQSKAFINYFLNPITTNKQTFLSAFFERYNLFIKYCQQLFPIENKYMAFTFLFFIAVIFFSVRKQITKLNNNILLFLSSLIGFVFLLTLLNKNNFFWDYYLDGIQFMLLFIIIIIFSFKTSNNLINHLKSVVMVIFMFLNIFVVYSELSKRTIPQIGLRADDRIVNYFIENTGNKDFCLRIYTPPVIPYTYNYLFSYYSHKQKVKYPGIDYKNNKCFYLVDKDTYQFRVDKWEKENKPDSAKVTVIKQFENGTVVKLVTLK